MDFAPIVLFTFNRPRHTYQTVQALLKNREAKYSTLIVYSDGPRDGNSEQKVCEVRSYLHTIKGFKNIFIIERQKNIGLASNIILGVTEVIQQFGSAIILEDDIITSPAFLSFMNLALKFYEDKKNIWHISGWNYPVKTKGLPDTFLWRVMNCWGWATWADRWSFFEKNSNKLIKEFSKKDIHCFNLDGHVNFWQQVLLNHKRKIESWAIFWYATIFLHKGLCLNPCLSYTLNIGHDGSGIHCPKKHFGQIRKLNENREPMFPINLKEDQLVVRKIKKLISGKKFYFIEFSNKVLNLIKRIS